ncbi:MAG: hypothetical protein UX17_C0064G0010 [Parcubacteria group bacterium GW2011_GWC2_45_7]|nr:MAG: hypothetical protein UX17_C0064G0010 [Parcubacteria group bacterium GW2011_GWC2_45_7]
MKSRFWIGIFLLAIASVLFAYRGRIVAFVTERIARRELPPAQTYEKVASSTSVIISERSEPQDFREPRAPVPDALDIPPSDEVVELKLPKAFNMAVPFTSQAPFEDWSLPYREACEEASIAMVDAFFKGRAFTKANATSEILALVEWQTNNLGHFEDTNVEETARILRERYGYENVQVIYDPTIEDIKREVAQGWPVILPAAGRLLGNRYFRQPGPLYHMLVVRGWTKDGMIITNDPGTKRGEGYLYEPNVLMNAVHDWNGGDVLSGRKAMIVVHQ